MMAKRKQLLTTLLLLLPIWILAQGKIAGRITDADGGFPLTGVNVAIEGTTQGTSSDLDGNYTILNVRPGTYTLVFSFIGYQKQSITNVRVSTGQTTRYNIELREEVIEGDEIVVQADRPLIQKDLTASKKTVVAEEIDALPVESFTAVLATQAGVNQGAGGELHIRGGRSNEISYLVDGLSVANPFNTNGLATTVAVDAIQELTVISGAFNAEYGKAMSGIVNLVTKEGGTRHEGSVSLYGGERVTSHGDIFMLPSGVQLNNYTYEANLSGPVPGIGDKVSYFMSIRGHNNDGHIYGVREHLPSDSANFNGAIPYYEIHGNPWWEYLPDSARAGQVPSELVPMNTSTSLNFLGKLTLRPMKGVKVEYSFLHDEGQYKPFDFAYRYNPDGSASVYDKGTNHSLHWTHAFSDKAFYAVKLSYALNGYKSYLYEDPLDPRYVIDRNGAGSGNIIGFPGTNYAFGGNEKGHVYENSRSLRSKIDYTQQVGAIHEVKLGVEANLHSLDRENFVVLYDGNVYLEPTVPDVDTPAHDKYENQRVTEFSAYAQDKLEFEDVIINAGLRYEYFDPNGLYIPNLLDPQGEKTQAEKKQLLLPRLGISFPITDQGIIHLSYGHFAQMPSLRNLYINPDFEFPKGSAPTFGNTNMRPERTVQYEIGLQQQLGEVLAFDATVYFKDIRDYLALQTVRYSTIAGEDLFSIYLNRDYANVKGFTFALTKRRERNGILSATLDYTFQIAEGNSTDANAFFFNFLSGKENELEIVPLSFDQRHIISSTVTLTRPGNWNLSFIGSYSTGYPYTPLLYDTQFDQLPNSSRKPSQFDLDAQLYKEFRFGDRLRVRSFVKVFNVLDRLNERFVFNDTGRATYSLNGYQGAHAAWEPFYGQPGVHNLEEYNTRPHWYSAPREIRVGASFSF